jgi:hypothetical protein
MVQIAFLDKYSLHLKWSDLSLTLHKRKLRAPGCLFINRPPFSDVNCHFWCRRNGERIGRTSRKGLGVSCGNHKKCSEANCCTGEVIHATSRQQDFSFDIKTSNLKPVSSSAAFIFSVYSEGSAISCGLGYRYGEARNYVPLLSNVVMNLV